MTMRREAIFQDVVSGHMEHLSVELPAIEYRALSRARAVVPNVTAFAVVAPFTSAVALEKTAEDGQGAHHGAGQARTKTPPIVKIDPRRLFRAVGLNTQPARDVHIYPDERGTLLDPSCTSPAARTSKMGIDATRRLAPVRTIRPNRVPADVLAGVDITEILKRRS